MERVLVAIPKLLNFANRVGKERLAGRSLALHVKTIFFAKIPLVNATLLTVREHAQKCRRFVRTSTFQFAVAMVRPMAMPAKPTGQVCLLITKVNARLFWALGVASVTWVPDKIVARHSIRSAIVGG